MDLACSLSSLQMLEHILACVNEALVSDTNSSNSKNRDIEYEVARYGYRFFAIVYVLHIPCKF